MGTPGRLLDFSHRKAGFEKDQHPGDNEADRLFDMGFLPDIRRLLKKILPIRSGTPCFSVLTLLPS